MHVLVTRIKIRFSLLIIVIQRRESLLEYVQIRIQQGQLPIPVPHADRSLYLVCLSILQVALDNDPVRPHNLALPRNEALYQFL